MNIKRTIKADLLKVSYLVGLGLSEDQACDLKAGKSIEVSNSAGKALQATGVAVETQNKNKIEVSTSNVATKSIVTKPKNKETN